MAKTKVVICPYCGDTQPAGDRCQGCNGLFEPLSRQATQNEMGPWFLRDPNRPFHPGCSYETLVRLIDRGQVGKYTIVRGPTTRQFWTVARRVPGIAHLLGYCHNCDASVDASDHGCHACGVPFGAYLDRNYLGLADVRPLPWDADGVDEGERPGGERFSWMYPQAAAQGGISSFASDAELRGQAPPSGPGADGQPSAVAFSTAQAIATPGSEGLPEPDDAPAPGERRSDSAVNNLRRRVAAQKRTITTLIVVVVVCVAMTAIALVVSMGG
jgi:hypothetical protein